MFGFTRLAGPRDYGSGLTDIFGDCRSSQTQERAAVAISNNSLVFSPTIEEKAESPLTVTHVKRYHSGWRLVTSVCIAFGLCVFILNLSVVAWASTFPNQDGFATVFEGSCSRTKNSKLWLHVAINALSTLLLGASNFCMQVLYSPEREHIDKAHGRHRWLAIGIPGYRNLFYIGWKRSVLWLLLGFSSIPLHLLYNASVVDTLSSNAYIVNAVARNFITGGYFNVTVDYGSEEYNISAQILASKAKEGSLVNMTTFDCIKTYSSYLVSDYGNLALVFDVENKNNSLLNQLSGWDAQARAGWWICNPYDNGNCNPNQQDPESWNPFAETSPGMTAGYVSYCLAEKTDHPCQLNIGITILLIVVVCNAIKTLCFVCTLWVCNDPMVTSGDLVSSYLSRPDTNLTGRCLAGRREVEKVNLFWKLPLLPVTWVARRRLWASAAPLSMWLSTFLPGLSMIFCVVGICVGLGLWTDLADIVNGGFGTPLTSALIPVNGLQSYSSTAATLLANTPQILVSYFYVSYNGLFTAMLGTAEWVQYSLRRSGLRVTWPKGHQKSRYYLQLPYRYSVPLLAASTLLHWLISSSLFLVRINTYSASGQLDPNESVSATGFSAYAIIFAVALGGVVLMVVLLYGLLRRYPATMPLGGTCSAAIAAACQPGEEQRLDPDMAHRQLQWGVLATGMSEGDMRHASFSANEVEPLIDGVTYA